MEELEAASRACREQHRRSKRTQKNYSGHVRRFKAFIAETAKQKRQELKKGNTIEGAANIDLDMWEKACENPPNRLVVKALEMFIMQKCVKEGLGYKTYEDIHSSICDWFDNL